MPKFSITGSKDKSPISIVIDADDSSKATSVARQMGIKVNAIEQVGAPAPGKSTDSPQLDSSRDSSGRYTRYSDVPIIRRYWFVITIFALGAFGFALFPANLGLIFWATGILWTGDVYRNKADSNGTLIRLGWSTRICALIFAIVACIGSALHFYDAWAVQGQ